MSASHTAFHGVFPYIVSPIRADGSVDAEVLARMTDDFIKAGVHGITPLGSTGEFAYLSQAQRRRVVEVVIEAAAGRVPVVAGVTSTTIADATAQARDYAAMGCDGILAILEAYFPLSDDGVYSYFKAIADAVTLPVVLYTNPNFQRSDLSLPVIDRLSHIDNIGYIKDASFNTGRLLSIINKLEGRMRVFAASAHIPACVMMIGGVGWMAGPACVAPRQSVALYEMCRQGDWARALALQKPLWSLNQRPLPSTRWQRPSRVASRCRAMLRAIRCRRRPRCRLMVWPKYAPRLKASARFSHVNTCGNPAPCTM